MSSDKPGNDKDARGKTPGGSRWRKGQCGNPRRIYRRRPRSMHELIDRAFARKITVWDRGIPERMTVYEAIVLRLSIKATTGSKRAFRIWRRYKKFAESRRGCGGHGGVIIQFGD